MALGFGTLLVIALAGLGGPLLGALPRPFVPVVVGEILAGVIVGPEVLSAVHPTNATIATFSEVGFAMLMLTAGMHLPLRDTRLATSLRTGALLAAGVAILAVPAGLLAATIAGGGHAAVYAVVLASGSAAVLLPALEEVGVGGPIVTTVMAQVALADIFTIVSVPIVLQPSRFGDALGGGALVALTAIVLLLLARRLARQGAVERLRTLSKHRRWALDLRVSLVVLFLLAWIAQKSSTSILIAGFSAGVMVALIGGPKRLSTQVRGIAEGFFVPLYFIVLGARLDLGGLGREPSLIALAVALIALNAAIHLGAAAILRRPLAGALAATAQLGVPAAVASIGLSEHVLSAGTATAIVLSALGSIAITTFGVSRLRALPQAGAAAPSGAGASRPAAA